MPLPTMSPSTFRRVAAAAVALLCTITLTGALVRLTGSGLGCSDWPNCEQGTLVQASDGHQAIEQLNRLFTGIVSVAVILAVLGSLAARYSRIGAGKICTVIAPTDCHWDPAVAPPVPARPMETPKVSPQTIEEAAALLSTTASNPTPKCCCAARRSNSAVIGLHSI